MSQDFINQTFLTENSAIIQGANALGDNIIGALGAWLDGLTEKVKNMEKTPLVMNRGGGDFKAAGPDVTPQDTPIARSKQSPQISSPEKELQPHIQIGAKQAVQAMSNSMAMMHVEDHNVSPPSTPSLGSGRGMGGMAMG